MRLHTAKPTKQETVLRAMLPGVWMVTDDVHQQCVGLKRNQVHNALVRLVAKGRIRAQGNTTQRRYMKKGAKALPPHKPTNGTAVEFADRSQTFKEKVPVEFLNIYAMVDAMDINVDSKAFIIWMAAKGCGK